MRIVPKKKRLYKTTQITDGAVNTYLGTERWIEVQRYYEMVGDAILRGVSCDIVLQTESGIKMSFHSAGSVE